MTSPTHYRAGGIIYQRATPDDDENLQRLLRDNAMEGWVKLSLQRAPSFFAGEGLIGESDSMIAYADNTSADLVGMYSCLSMMMFVNGMAYKVGYLGGLRVSAAYRNKIRVVRQGYESVPVLMAHHKPILWMTSIASDNRVALRLLEAGLRGMPRYRPVAKLQTLAISTRHGEATSVLRPATIADIPALLSLYNRRAADYQFAPVLDEQWLSQLNNQHGLSLSDFLLMESDQQLIGCVALWDQRCFKQVVAHRYRFPINLLRVPYNLWAKYTRRLVLPAPGRALQSLYLSFAIFPENETLAIAMMRDALHHACGRSVTSVVLGISPENPLHELFVKRFKPHIYHTQIETVSWSEDEMIRLDSRPVQPEVALL